MLDDLKYIHEKDGQDALGIAKKQWEQLAYGFDIGDWQINHVTNVVFAGMGGSALAALLAQSWPGFEIPFEISRDYSIPSYVSDTTLFIASSYSGNTEETIEAIGLAQAKGAQIAVITAGGQLQTIAQDNNLPLALLPSGIQPRFATLYSFKALITILEHANLLDKTEASKELARAGEFLHNVIAKWRPDVRTDQNLAKQLALELSGSTPVVYAGPKLFPTAYKWKISFNENAKNVAWCNQFPEFNHNEFLGWSSHPIDKPYKIIQLVSHLEHERVQKRFEVSNKLLSGRWPHPLTVEIQGSDIFEQLLYAVALGDFVSLYLALLNGLNPTPVDLIEKFKTDLNN
ncbi:bifunctional phosphoglucose/phosphomannose isomerase [Candidatus Saccharibacteria bacterium]|nr:bifunctional phosphoglucose/phosphomannose isomerase [Candidatus Saccharibacteria bacterium]